MTDGRRTGTVTPSYPTSLKIGAYDWTVESVEDLRDKETGDRLYGQCDPSQLVIRMNADIEREQLVAETLWHEVLHAIWNFFHLDAKEDEEAAVSCMSTGITMVMRDNPDLKKYLWRIWR